MQNRSLLGVRRGDARGHVGCGDHQRRGGADAAPGQGPHRSIPGPAAPSLSGGEEEAPHAEEELVPS